LPDKPETAMLVRPRLQKALHENVGKHDSGPPLAQGLASAIPLADLNRSAAGMAPIWPYEVQMIGIPP
jgi:hypothetical protein